MEHSNEYVAAVVSRDDVCIDLSVKFHQPSNDQTSPPPEHRNAFLISLWSYCLVGAPLRRAGQSFHPVCFHLCPFGFTLCYSLQMGPTCMSNLLAMAGGHRMQIFFGDVFTFFLKQTSKPAGWQTSPIFLPLLSKLQYGNAINTVLFDVVRSLRTARNATAPTNQF